MKQRQTIIAICYDKKGRILSIGHNQYTKTHPVQKHFARKAGQDAKEFLHAEISAIVRAKGSVIQHIQILRIGNTGKMQLAKPCSICMLAIKAYNIKQISWSTNEGTIYYAPNTTR